jgi:hypothetical protein
VDFVILLRLLAPGSAAEEPRGTPVRTVRFDEDSGQPPRGFTCARTGKGRPGIWRIVHEPGGTGPSGVLAQTDEDSTVTGSHFASSTT